MLYISFHAIPGIFKSFLGPNSCLVVCCLIPTNPCVLVVSTDIEKQLYSMWSENMQDVVLLFQYLLRLAFVLICDLVWRQFHEPKRRMCIL